MAEWADAYDYLMMPLAAQAIRDASKLMLTIDFESCEDPREEHLDHLENQYYATDEELNLKAAALIRQNWKEAFKDISE